MRSSHSLDALSVQFDDDNAVANAGLLLPATLAQHLGLRDLLDAYVNLGVVAGGANPGAKVMTLIASLIAGGECIDDADALRAGETDQVLGHWVAAPSTLGTFLRAFSFGHSRQLDMVSSELLARAWGAGARPDEDEPLTIDVDSTICETYGLNKQGGSKFTYNHVRGYHPLISVIAKTGDVVHTRLRGGPSHVGRGAASFVAETVTRVRAAGATGEINIRADSGFYNHKVVGACRKADVRFSITVKMMGKGGVQLSVADRSLNRPGWEVPSVDESGEAEHRLWPGRRECDHATTLVWSQLNARVAESSARPIKQTAQGQNTRCSGISGSSDPARTKANPDR